MILPISDEYRIKTDEYNWIVQKRSGARLNRKTGLIEPNWKEVGFHSSCEQASIALYQRMVRTSDADSLVDAIKVCEHSLTLISTALSPIFKVIQVANLDEVKDRDDSVRSS